jgi:hypothetical protein
MTTSTEIELAHKREKRRIGKREGLPGLNRHCFPDGDDFFAILCLNHQRIVSDNKTEAPVSSGRFPNGAAYCAICGVDVVHCLEVHHVASKNRSDLCTGLCLNHHCIISDFQRDHQLPGYHSDALAQAALERGLSDLLKVRAEWQAEYDRSNLPRLKLWRERSGQFESLADFL